MRTTGAILLTIAPWTALAGWAAPADPEKQPASLPPEHVLDHGSLFRPAALGGGDLILLSLAFSPDGKLIASAGGGSQGADVPAQGEVKLWEVATGKLLHTLPIEKGIVFCVEFSPDGQLLAAASGPGTATRSAPGEIRLWNPTTGQLVRKFEGHDCGAYVASFSPDGTRLATGGIATFDESKIGPVRGGHASGDLKLWDLKTGKELWTRGGHSGTVGALVFAADGKTLASSGGLFDGQVKLWDVAEGTELGALRIKAEVLNPVAWDAKAITLLILGQGLTAKELVSPLVIQVSRWDVRQKKQLHATQISNGNAYRTALSHRGDLLACACHDGVKIYDVAKQSELRSFPSKLRMRPVAFSPQDDVLAAGGDDGTVKIWSVAKLRQ